MSYQLELRHFRYFLVVAEELHFRKAAEKLFISQPGLSRQIKQMEEVMGVELLSRTKKKVALTAAGSYLKEEIEFILNHLERTQEELRRIGQGHSGTVRIGFLGSAMQGIIPDLLLKLKRDFPGVQTSLEELSNASQVNAVLKDRLDIGFVRLARVPEGLKIRPVFKDSFSLVLPESHPVAHHSFKGLADFRHDEFILFDQAYSPLYYDTIMSICEDAGFAPKVSHKSVHAQTIFKLVENKMGIAIVPSSLRYGFDMKVKFITLDQIPQQAVLSAVWKPDNRNQALKNCLRLLFDENFKE